MKVLQIAQRAIDLERASRFYSRLLGSEPLAVFDPPGLLFFDLGGVRLLLERGASSAVIYLSVPDVRESVETLRDAGIKIVAEPHVIFSHEDNRLGPAGTDEWMGFIEDSEGNTVGLVSQLPEG
ncbi:VOC family protein [Arthrobacter sp. ISL-30]|uniref:VOC family protein n=1 Tax=Arthrobacter sp. ISL-30 TaxID=2819109 RepID=UPI001BE98F36|nr:VOC family protein [Arthrobacter sp. ISL-30]MBT2512791.1 methylmalonyl-CoA epimerase [Arthrobacter sp. ISL-30]